MPDHCCSHPLRAPARVDVVFAEAGLRFRHLPGEICLRCRDVTAPSAKASSSLQQSIRACMEGDPRGMTVHKVHRREPDPHDISDRCASCGSEYEPAYLTMAIGEHGGLAVERLRGRWCWRCSEGIIPDNGREARERLMRFEPTLESPRPVPSLLYDTPDHPRSVQIEVTTRCNLTCDYCTHRLLVDRADISAERLERILDRIDMRCVDNIDFTGLGEPAMHPNLPEMIEAVRRRGDPRHIRIVTNGTILTREKFERLCDAGITSIAFSVDSMDPATFARNRGGARLDIVLRHLEDLVRFRQERGLQRLQIKIKAVLTDDPFNEARRILEYSAGLGIEMPHFSCLDGREAVAPQYDQSWMRNDWVEREGMELSQWTGSHWNELTGGRMPIGDRGAASESDRWAGFINPMLIPQDLCRWAVDAAFIAADAHALSCCEQMIDIPRRTYGLLETGTLGELWRDDLFWGFRLPLSVDRVPAGCVGCSRAPKNGIPLERSAVIDPANIPILTS